jgi:hypothetical protein
MSRHVERELHAWEWHRCDRCGRQTISHGAYILHRCEDRTRDTYPVMTVAQEAKESSIRLRLLCRSNEEFIADFRAFRDYQPELPMPVVEHSIVYWPSFAPTPPSTIVKPDN